MSTVKTSPSSNTLKVAHDCFGNRVSVSLDGLDLTKMIGEGDILIWAVGDRYEISVTFEDLNMVVEKDVIEVSTDETQA